MAFNEQLADRVRRLLKGKRGVSERRMFGGLAFMLRDKMCCGVLNDDLVARIGVENYEKALEEAHVRPMDFTGRPLKGYVYIGKDATKTDRGLQKWVQRSVAFTASLKAKGRR
jgi:TfoX/Sxy family transcriptional regulator of competence genes